MTTCMRKIEFDAGHRLVDHEGLCANPHGHRYVAEIECEAPLDDLGRVVDFGEVKRKVGKWIDDNWDHATILNVADAASIAFYRSNGWRVYVMQSNPTAENIAAELLRVAQSLLSVKVVRVRIWETPNCYAEVRA